MKAILTLAITAMMLTPLTALTAERAPSQARIEAARSALNDFKARAGDNKAAAGDIDEAASHIDKAVAALKAGEKMFGGVSDEADLDVRHETSLTDLALKRGAARLEQTKIAAESAALAKKIDVVKAKVKIFDDFRSEIARLKKEAAANEKAAKNLDQLKEEKNSLEKQIAQLSADNKKLGTATAEIAALKTQLEAAAAENKKLKGQLEKLEADKVRPPEIKAVPSAPQKPVPPVKDAEPQAKVLKPAATDEPLRELVTAPPLKTEDAVPPDIVPADGQASK